MQRDRRCVWTAGAVALVALLACALTPCAVASPGVPMMTYPAQAEVIMTNRPDFTWTGDPFDAYEVHVSLYNWPTAATVWDSGVGPGSTATSGSCMCGSLPAQSTYYVFVRLRDAGGWGPSTTTGPSTWLARFFRAEQPRQMIPCVWTTARILSATIPSAMTR